MTRLCGWMILLAAASAQTTVERDAGRLLLGQHIEREIAPGQVDLFTVDAEAGQFVHVVVQKKAVDVRLILTDANGETAMTADNPNGTLGPVPASLIATRSSTYRVTVKMSPEAKVGGGIPNRSDSSSHSGRSGPGTVEG